MKYFEYSQSQLEHKANELIERHDKERLVKAKNIDVYDIVDLNYHIKETFWLFYIFSKLFNIKK
mgnify:CR=1 FL=1